MDNLKDLEAMQVVLTNFRQISKHNREIIIKMLSGEHELIGDKVDDPYLDIKKRYLAAGGRYQPLGIIPYIKEVRAVNRIGLKEAKDLVESW